jgi:4-amino-4-deoxy-L-arabinose transferase-like glycosyltransferase
LSLRFGFVVLFAGSTWILFRWTANFYGEAAGYYAAMALNLAAYYTAAAGAFALPDGPLLFFSLFTMWRVSEALIRKPDRMGPWIWVGVGCAGAMLSKYLAVFLPFGTLVYVVLTPAKRSQLKTVGPYLASMIGILGLVPVLIWNMEHSWTSLAFQSSRAVGLQFRPAGLGLAFFGPMGFLFPWIWVPLMQVLIERIRRIGGASESDRLSLCMAFPPLVLFTVVACFRPILPHWMLIGFLPLFPLLGDFWAKLATEHAGYVQRWIRFMTAACITIASIFLIQARFGLIDFPFRDPCIEISGWESVAAELDRRGIIGRENTFLFTDHWYESGQLSFAVRNRMQVACYNQGDARGFAYWSNPDDWVGQNGILIDTENREWVIDRYRDYFQQIDPLPDITMTRGGRPFRKLQVYFCEKQTRPFPFRYSRQR